MSDEFLGGNGVNMDVGIINAVGAAFKLHLVHVISSNECPGSLLLPQRRGWEVVR